MDHPGEPTRLIVYGHNFCGQARRLADLLAKHHIDHEWRDVQDDSRFRDELRQLARGYLSVPTVIFPDGTVMVEPWPEAVLTKLSPRQPGLMERLLGR
jgi:mycoredoxin